MTGSRPEIIPIFPLSGALLLPGGKLPLNIFEPRYLAMTEDALAGEKIIGMIQPKKEKMSCGNTCVHETGCAGLISRAERTPDGRILIELDGQQRFQVLEELPPLRGYRRVKVKWLDEATQSVCLDRARLLPALRKFLRARGLDCQWSKLECCPDEKLITTLAMVCPFSPAEQQALVEAPSCAARGELLTTLIEMAGMPSGGRPN